MGYMRHHAIIVSSWHLESLEKARQCAITSFDPCQVSNVVTGIVNTENTFLVGPDGSKEGWDQSNEGDQDRAEYIHWLVDYGKYLSWIEVMYADDKGAAEITAHGSNG